MAKTSQSANFRRVDVDALDEERFQDDTSDMQTSSGPSEAEIQSLLNAKKNSEALKLLLNNAPFNGTVNEKSQAFHLMIRVMTQHKTPEIDGTVKQLSQHQVDMLMKYIYRGFSEPTDSSCGMLLNWHEKVYAVSGLGGIMRVLTCRKSV